MTRLFFSILMFAFSIAASSKAMAFTLDTNNFITTTASVVYSTGFQNSITVTATCPTGDFVVTGICYSTSGFDGHLSAYGRNNSSWLCTWDGNPAYSTYSSQVTCAHP